METLTTLIDTEQGYPEVTLETVYASDHLEEEATRKAFLRMTLSNSAAFANNRCGVHASIERRRRLPGRALGILLIAAFQAAKFQL